MTANGNGLLLYRRREIASRLRDAGADAKARSARLRFDALYAEIEADAFFAKADELEGSAYEARDAATQQT
jgi:hypothetical protein